MPETLPDAYGALKFLAGLPRIDAQRIGILGFSWGGVAHVANYPVCWDYNRVPGYAFNAFTGAPVLIQAGALDAYDAPDTCAKLVAALPAAAQRFVDVKTYATRPTPSTGCNPLSP